MTTLLRSFLRALLFHPSEAAPKGNRQFTAVFVRDPSGLIILTIINPLHRFSSGGFSGHRRRRYFIVHSALPFAGVVTRSFNMVIKPGKLRYAAPTGHFCPPGKTIATKEKAVNANVGKVQWNSRWLDLRRRRQRDVHVRHYYLRARNGTLGPEIVIRLRTLHEFCRDNRWKSELHGELFSSFVPCRGASVDRKSVV